MTKKNTQFKSSLLKIFILAMVISICSCTKKISFLNSSLVPAARGYVEINSDKNKNNVIEIHLTDLAEVQRLEPPRRTYVVWTITNQNMIKNLGQIKSSSGMISKQLKASFRTVTSFNPTRVFITAEDDANTQYAGKQIVLSTKNF